MASCIALAAGLAGCTLGDGGGNDNLSCANGSSSAEDCEIECTTNFTLGGSVVEVAPTEPPVAGEEVCNYYGTWTVQIAAIDGDECGAKGRTEAAVFAANNQYVFEIAEDTTQTGGRGGYTITQPTIPTELAGWDTQFSVSRTGGDQCSLKASFYSPDGIMHFHVNPFKPEGGTTITGKGQVDIYFQAQEF